MSYILDALKKSEVQRHAGRIPTVAAPHGVLIESPRASRIGLLGGIVVALAVVVGAGWWWASRFPDRPVQSVAVLPPASPAAPTPPQSRVENSAAPVSAESTKNSQVLPRLKLAISLPPREPPAVGLSGDQAKPAVQPPQTTTPPAPGRDAAAPATIRSGVVPYADLPLAIRQGMPPLVVGGFAAGDSGGAMVMVDDKLVREGDEVVPGIRVEKILPDSAEFTFKGYRFRR